MPRKKIQKSFPVNLIKLDKELTAHGFVTDKDRQELSEEMGYNPDYIYKTFHAGKDRVPSFGIASAVTIEVKYGIKRENYECLEEEAKGFQDKFFHKEEPKKITKPEPKDTVNTSDIKQSIDNMNKNIKEELINLNTSVINLTSAILSMTKILSNMQKSENHNKSPYIFMDKVEKEKSSTGN